MKTSGCLRQTNDPGISEADAAKSIASPNTRERDMKHLLKFAALAIAVAGPVAADGYYDGKTINYIIATSPGGGYDAYGRLIGRYLGEKLGADKVIFNNLPGAGHIIGANTLFASDPDGLTIGTFNTGLIYAQILQQEGVRFDLTKFGWVGKASSDARAMVLSTNSGLKSFDDLVAVQDQVLFAASGIGSANFTETKMLASGLDLKIKMIAGYNGNEGEMAMMRGEVVGQIASYESVASFVNNGSGFYALAIGGNFQPQAIDYAKTNKGRAIVNLIDANSNLGRLTATPPGVAPEVLEALRDGYMAVMADPKFLADAQKLGLSIDPARGDKVEALVKAALEQSPETVTIISEALEVEIPTIKVSTAILSLEDGNKAVGFMSGDAQVVGAVSGSRTVVMVNGAEASRKELAVGMLCDIEYDPNAEGNEFKTLTCTAPAAVAATAPAAGGVVTVSSAIMALEDDNKVVGFRTGDTDIKGSVSGKRTAVTVNGAKAERDALAVGMVCDMTYDQSDDSHEFSTLACNG